MNNGPFRERIKEVFDLCDTEKKGYISVDHFVELAMEFIKANGQSNTEFVDRMVSVLDSEGNGKISFQDFSKGVNEILQSSHTMSNNVINDFLGRRMSIEDPKIQNTDIFETIDSQELMMFDDMEISSDAINNSTPLSTNNYYCKKKQQLCGSVEEDADSGLWSTTPHEINCPPKKKVKSQDEDCSSCQSNICDKAPTYNYEDWEDEGTPSLFFRNNTPTSLSTPRSSMKSVHRISAPSSRSGSFRKSVTPSAVASQLYKSTQNCSDLYNDPNDVQVEELKEKVEKLEDQLQSMSETQKKSENSRCQLRDKNTILVERRVHLLEEQLRDMEVTNEERFKEEQRKHRELLLKTEKDKSNQIDILAQSLKFMEGEYTSLKTEVPHLKSENDQLKRQNFSLERELAKLRQECSELNDEKLAMQDLLQNEQTKINKEKHAQLQLLDELSLELNELRQFKSSIKWQNPSQRRENEMPRTLKAEMEAQITQLKHENVSLKEQMEELQVTLLNRQIEEGQALVQSHKSSFNTLAAELEEVPKNELMQALKKEQESNAKLREYIESMTLRILENNPNLLEINGKKNVNKKR